MKPIQSKKTIFFTFFLAIGLTAGACEGPEGPMGADGPEGPEGPQGPQGEEGTANVIYSGWMDIDWNAENGTTFKSMYIEEPRVAEEDFRANGTVMVYIKQEHHDGTAILALSALFGATDFIGFYLLTDVPGAEDVNGIVMYIRAIDGTTPVSDLEEFEVRYVLIPGGVQAKMPESFLKDYDAVKQYYGIPD